MRSCCWGFPLLLLLLWPVLCVITLRDLVTNIYQPCSFCIRHHHGCVSVLEGAHSLHLLRFLSHDWYEWNSIILPSIHTMCPQHFFHFYVWVCVFVCEHADVCVRVPLSTAHVEISEWHSLTTREPHQREKRGLSHLTDFVFDCFTHL